MCVRFICNTGIGIVVLLFLIACQIQPIDKIGLLSGNEYINESLSRLDDLDKSSPPNMRAFENALVGFSRSPRATTKIANDFETADGYTITVYPDLSEARSGIQKIIDGKNVSERIPLDLSIKIRSCIFRDPDGTIVARRSWGHASVGSVLAD